MCYDIAMMAPLGAVEDSVPELDVDRYTAAHFEPVVHTQAQAYRKHPVMVYEDDRYKLKTFEWGVIAGHMHTPEEIKKRRSGMCNARSEKIVADRGSIWHRLRQTRCLIPVTGIFEHREVSGYKHKIPYYIGLKARPLFFLPGLYNYPEKADVETGEITGTFTVVTRAANTMMAQIHNGGDQAGRMPLFLPHDMELKWLQPQLSDKEMQNILNYEMSAEALDYHPVYTIRTTKERPDGGSKIDRYDWPSLPPLGVDSIATQGGLFG